MCIRDRGLSEEAAGMLEGGMRARLKSDCAPWTPPDRPEYGFGARFYKVRRLSLIHI